MRNRDLKTGKFMDNHFKVECAFCHKEMNIIEWKLKHNKKHFCSCQCKYSFYSGANHNSFKHGLRIRKRFCECGKKLSESSDSIRCRGCANSGILNHGYIDGSSESEYGKGFTENLKEKIRNRDCNKCVVCGMNKKEHYEKYTRNLEAHHIDHDRSNCKEENLETRCKQCNLDDKIRRRKNNGE